MQNAIIFGANSTISTKVIYKLAQSNYNLYLFGRNIIQLNELIDDLKVRYPNINIFIDDYDAQKDTGNILQQKINKAFECFKQVELVLIAHGSLPNQKEYESDWQQTLLALQTNGLSVIEICHIIANKLKEQKHGTIAVISSVAGERGRQSNYIYGTAKGMINIYLQGLRNNLSMYNIQVLTILPGFVDTKMTTEFKKGLLWAKPDRIASDIIKAINKKRDVLYTPWFWRYIMYIIKLIPERVFKKLKL